MEVRSSTPVNYGKYFACNAAVTTAVGVGMVACGLPLTDVGALAVALLLTALVMGLIWQRWFTSETLGQTVFFAWTFSVALISLSGMLPGPPWVRLGSWFALVAGCALLSMRHLPAMPQTSKVELLVMAPALILGSVCGWCTHLLIGGLPQLVGTDSWLTAGSDLYFFEALSRGLHVAGFPESGLLSGWPIRYHLGAYAIVGQLNGVADPGPLVNLTRTVPALVIPLLAVGSGSWAWTKVKNWWAPTIAAAAVAVGGPVVTPAFVGFAADAVQPYSPSTTIGALLLVASVWSAIRVAEKTGGPGRYILLGLLGCATMISKVPAGLALVVVAVTLSAVLAFTRSPKRALGLVVAAAMVPTVAFLVTEAGLQSGSTLVWARWDLVSIADLHNWYALLLIPLMYSFGALTRWVGIAAWPSRPGGRTELWAGSSLCAVGFVALTLLSAASPNRFWIAVLAGVPAALLSVIGVLRLFDYPHGGRTLARLGAFSLVIAMVLVSSARTEWFNERPMAFVLLFIGLIGVALLVELVGVRLLNTQDRRVTAWEMSLALVVCVSTLFMPLVRIGESLVPTAFSYRIVDLQEQSRLVNGVDLAELHQSTSEAAAWFRGHGSTDAVVAVLTGGNLSVEVSTWPSALAGFRSYVAGIPRFFPGLAAKGSSDEVARRIAVQEAAATGDTNAKAILCSDGVSWVWYQGLRGLPPQAAPEFINDDVAVIRLKCDGEG